MPEVSVIVPVFNARDFISECLDSLLHQTQDDIEIILVDDHGTDDTFDIARNVAAEYIGPKKFVFTRTPENSGPGAARNVGINIAEGGYLAFVDADDTVSPDFCEKLLEAAKGADADMACCDISIGGKIHRNPDTSDKRFFLTHFISYFTTFIYRRQMLQKYGISFPKTGSAEDTCFLTCSLLAADGIAQVHDVLYFYRSNPDSVTSAKNRGRAAQRLESFRHLRRFAAEHGFRSQYRNELSFIALKKGWALAIKDLIFG